MIRPDGSWVSSIASAAILILLSQHAHSQEYDSNAVHWAYSSYFGTGWYRIGDSGDAFVIRVTPRFDIRESSLEDGQREIGVEFRIPFTAGMDTFTIDDPTGTLDPGNLTTLSFTPGFDITIPVTQRWSLKPYASLGFGIAINEGKSAWNYWAGIKSKFVLASGKLDWSLLNSAGYVGFTPSTGPAEDFWPLMIGLEMEHDFGEVTLGGQQAMLAWHGMYTTFENNLDAVLEDGSQKPITDQWEIGLAMRQKENRMKLWLFHFDRLGLAYRFSSNGDLKGIAIVFRSVFDR